MVSRRSSSLSRGCSPGGKHFALLVVLMIFIAGSHVGEYNSLKSPKEYYANAAAVVTELPANNAMNRSKSTKNNDMSNNVSATIIRKGTKSERELKIDDSMTNSRKDDSHHNSHIAILPLLPWENETISNDHRIEKSSAPRHIPRHCALGSTSAGGGTHPSRDCGSERSAYDRVHQRVRELLPEQDGYGCDVCRILDIIVEKNLTLSFWGDSMHQQVFDGFVCEMYRRNYTIISTTTQKLPNSTMQKIREITTVTVASPNWRQHQENRHATIKFFAQYRPKSKVEEIYHESIVPLLEGGTDILFFNFGLHWRHRQRKKYQDLMLTALTALKQHATRNISLFAFRETSAQHFDTPLGEWPAVSVPKYKCTPLTETKKRDPLFGWRNRDILDAVNRSRFNIVPVDPSGKVPMPPLLLHSDEDEIAMLPFTEFTSELHYMHPTECTHFCSTPHLWIPLWRSLRLAMERRFS